MTKVVLSWDSKVGTTLKKLIDATHHLSRLQKKNIVTPNDGTMNY